MRRRIWEGGDEWPRSVSDLFKTGRAGARTVSGMDDVFGSAHRFVQSQGRLLEQRLFAACFLDGPKDGVIDALRGYQNSDGGFGHGLEPDKRCPASLPIDVEVAFQTIVTAGAVDRTMILRACEFLARTAAEAGSGGAVPLAFPVIEDYPRAEHWSDWTYVPGLNPTAGLVGLLYRLGIEHPWREQAAEYCWQQLEATDPPDGAHTLSEVLGFLAHVPDRERAAEHAAALAKHLPAIPMVKLDPDGEGYGLTPLHLARTADSPWRALFTDAQIDAHLDHLEGEQQTDGGWTITWTPPSEASALQWRGIVTLEAVRTLRSYGCLGSQPE